MAATTPVSPTTLWNGPRSGPIFELRNFFSGTRERCDLHVEHYANQHVINTRWVLVDAGLHYPEFVIEVALGNGFTAFQLLFHMGITPMAHVWEELYRKLSDPPTPIEDMDPAGVARFLGVELTPGQDKDQLLTLFVQRECNAHGYRVPDVLPFDHGFQPWGPEPPKCKEANCHTCNPPPDRNQCECMACSREHCQCPGCSAKSSAISSSEHEPPCALCEEAETDFDIDCENCRPPSTPGADSETLDTEE